MNATKCCYTIFCGSATGRVKLKIILNGEAIPYNPNPVFLGVTFDESLCFGSHFQNLRHRALKRLNILKLFSHRSWHLGKKTLSSIYRALIGSLFDYSFFTLACLSNTSIKQVQTVQNRALRIIHRLKYDSPTDELFSISGVLSIKQRFLQMGCRYILKCWRFNNKYIQLLIKEYAESWSEINANHSVLSTQLGYFYSLIQITFACVVLLRMYVACLVLMGRIWYDFNIFSNFALNLI